jgi:putative Ca2+/H+ antiporter (TMEM165/GDT1 family)
MGMEADGVSDEMGEAEEELADIDAELGVAGGEAVDLDTGEEEGADTEEGGEGDSAPLTSKPAAASGDSAAVQMTSAQKSALLSKAFILTFFAEWGDRSQIATIALAADMNPFGVIVGGVLGHSMCTGLAVVGGKALGTQISERTVSEKIAFRKILGAL